MKQIMIIASERSTTVEIENGTSRTTRGANFAAVAQSMHPEDRIVLAQFCAGILAALDQAAPAIKGKP